MKPRMNFIERVSLSPFEKYARFNIFPWKFIFHLLMVALCTYQAIKIISIHDKYARVQQQIFSQIYLQSDGSNHQSYYSLSQFSDLFFGNINKTQSLTQTLLQYSDVSDAIFELQVYYSLVKNSQQLTYHGDAQTFLKELQKIPLHSDNPLELKAFIQEVQILKLHINNIITYLKVDSQGDLSECLNWTVSIEYSFQSFASAQASLSTNSLECITGDNVFEEEEISAVHLMILMVSILCLGLSWKNVYETSKEYMIYKESLLTQSYHQLKEDKLNEINWKKSWQELGFFEKMKFFDFWFIISVTGHFFQLLGSLVSFLDDLVSYELVIFTYKQYLIGFSVMFAWITIIQYLQYNDEVNLLTATLSSSFENLFMFLLGVMPFFIGFAYLGSTMFWKYKKFQDASSSVITLFSILNGDIVNDTFSQTWAEGLAGQFYLILYVLLFYTAVQNILVTIIMEGYEESIKQREYKKYVEQKEQISAQIAQTVQKLEEPPVLEQKVADPDLRAMKLNTKKMMNILTEMERLGVSIKESELSEMQKHHILNEMGDSLDSLRGKMKKRLDIK